MPESPTGPHVQLAVFAELFIRGAQSGALSVINIVDGVTISGPPQQEMPPFSLDPYKILVNLWADQAKGRYSLKLRPQGPSKLYEELIDLDEINFGPTALGVDIARQMPPFQLTEEGTYWFDLLLMAPGDDDGQLLTRIPFTVQYQPMVTLQASQ